MGLTLSTTPEPYGTGLVKGGLSILFAYLTVWEVRAFHPDALGIDAPIEQAKG